MPRSKNHERAQSKERLGARTHHSVTSAAVHAGLGWTLMGDLATEPGLGGKVRLYDIEREAAEVNARIGNALSSRRCTRQMAL